MAAWAGFSEEELRRLQYKDQVALNASSRGRRPPPTNRSRQQLQREKALQLATQQNGPAPLPAEQQLAKPKVPALAQSPPKTHQENEALQRSRSVESEQGAQGQRMALPEEVAPLAKELEKQEVELREKTRLEQLQQEQRFMEEKNKRKKALLSKTIAEKSKRTQAEAIKLKRIQKELQALDDMVSNDIGILRSRIEQASWDYSGARKRFEKAEAEYVAAKLDLHKKTDVKEQLTEHLYAIIQQNEQRKSRKLEELMKQLEVEADEEGLDLEIEVEKMLHQQEEEARRAQAAGQENMPAAGQATGDCSDGSARTEGEIPKDIQPPESGNEKAGQDTKLQNTNSHHEAVGNEVTVSVS
ncbi:RAB6-interacting golgin isoform X2 [Amia ocellicauda]|uniref:RAB6-interacting golgin isoform X2 n=1 Tax=Amia ocellicauda TaxID=2972642 RepID=UPI0034641E4D